MAFEPCFGFKDLTWEVGDVQGLKSISLNDTKVLAKTIKVKYTPSLDALLSDIYISTSAAPTYLPAHQFQTKDPQGEVREFNLVNGGVAANDPPPNILPHQESHQTFPSFK